MTTRTPTAIELTITGCPAYSLSPNSRKHWRVRHRESQELKWLSQLAAGQVIIANDADMGPSGPVNLHWTIYLGKGRKQMDRDNATATLKPAMDGLVAAEMIENDTPAIVRAITVEQITWGTHRGDARIVVKIERAA